MAKFIPDDIVEIIKSLKCVDNTVAIPMQLSRTDYVKVNEVLERLGGKWDRKAKAHIFEEETAGLIMEVLISGEMPPKNLLAFFETPDMIIQAMLDHLEKPFPDRYLEPSAGNGAILKYVHALYPQAWPIAFELDDKRIEKLKELSFPIAFYKGDFLQTINSPKIPLVLMNPPFATERDKLEYIAHIERAFTWLEPNGTLLSIAPLGLSYRMDKRTVAMRTHIIETGQIFTLPEDAFKASGTNVRTVLVKMTKEN